VATLVFSPVSATENSACGAATPSVLLLLGNVSATENSACGVAVPVNLLPFGPVSATENSQCGSAAPDYVTIKYAYNAATQIAQWGFANLPAGSFAIGKNTIQPYDDSPAEALAAQDGSDIYLPAQCLPGSQNTSGTIGVIPPNSLLFFQFLWQVYDPTGQYTPESTASAISPYGATGGVPYGAAQIGTIFFGTIELAEEFGGYLIECYEDDLLFIVGIPPSEPGAVPLDYTVTNQGGTFFLRILLQALFTQGFRRVQDVNNNYYGIANILYSNNNVLLNSIVYYNPDSKTITYAGNLDQNNPNFINQYVLQSAGALTVAVPSPPPGGLSPTNPRYGSPVPPAPGSSTGVLAGVVSPTENAAAGGAVGQLLYTVVGA
jgi:hypothetical protein